MQGDDLVFTGPAKINGLTKFKRSLHQARPVEASSSIGLFDNQVVRHEDTHKSLIRCRSLQADGYGVVGIHGSMSDPPESSRKSKPQQPIMRFWGGGRAVVPP